MTDFAIYLHVLAAGCAAFVALWPISVLRRDVGVVDVWWAPGFFVAVMLVWWMSGLPDDTRALLALALVAAWALRLGAVMITRWLRHPAEDRRYQLIRKAWGASFWWKSLFIVFLLQAVMQWLIALGPLSVFRTEATALSWLAWLGCLIALAGLALEAAADWQLDKFKRAAPRDALCATGLRAHVRHPNYVGEMMFWWGVWLLIAEVAPIWAILSPILLTFLLAKVSGAPLLAETMNRSRPGFAAYAARTPAFLPRLGHRTATPGE